MHCQTAGAVGCSNWVPRPAARCLQVDRFYEAYIQKNPDSKDEFQRHQRTLKKTFRKMPGFPDGPYGVYEPFVHPVTGAQSHVSDTFDVASLGYRFDDLPVPRKQQLNAPPYYAVFRGINVLKMDSPRVVHVFVADKTKSVWTPPSDVTVDTLSQLPEFAGSGSIFFFALEQGACENCFERAPFDLYVDVTDALRANSILPRNTVLHCLVEDDDDQIMPLAQTPVPAPLLRGPRFRPEASSDTDTDDVSELQKELISRRMKASDVVDGGLGEKTIDAIKKFQRAAGLTEDGIAGPKTKAKLMQKGMLNDAPVVSAPTVASGEVMTWWLDEDSVPSSLLPLASTLNELQLAFETWSEPTGEQISTRRSPDDETRPVMPAESISWHSAVMRGNR